METTLEVPADSSASAPAKGTFDRSIDKLFRVIEALAATLVFVDIVLLLAGVIARYVFHRPLTWSDEVAVICFLWIAMLGSAIAARSDGHMRLTVVVNKLSPAWRRRATAVSGILSIVLMACLVLPAVQHAQEHWTTLTPALRISDGLRLCALVVGILLMLIGMVPRILKESDRNSLLLGAAVVAVLSLVLWVASPSLRSAGNWTLILFFVIGVTACVLGGVPIAYAFGISTVAYLQFVTTIPMTIVVARMDGGISELLLLSIPLFIILGLLLELTGMARTLINFLTALVGHVRGGLSYVLLGAMFLVSGISGSKAADMAAVAPVLVPEMKKRGYRDGELVALLASSGAMSETIPPSLVLIALGAVAGLSIAALFTAGVLPALIAAIALMVVAWFRARKSDSGTSTKASRRDMLRALVAALPVLALPLLIRIAVVEGVATATEVATIGVAYTLIVGLLFARDTEWRKMYRLLVDTASLSGVIMLIVGMATAMAWALTQSGVSDMLAQAMSKVPGGKLGFLLVSVLIFVILGSLLEGLPALVVLGPLLFPAAQIVGINEIHYAMVVIFAMGLGLFSPPFGVGYYMACVMAKIDPDAGMRAIWPYMAALLVVTLLLAAFPSISLAFL